MKNRPPRYNPNARPSANDTPCLGCNDREVGCHAKCEAYTEWRQRIYEEGLAIKKLIADEATIANYQIKQYEKAKGRKHNAQ